MAHLAKAYCEKAHFDKHTLGRVNSAIMLGLIGGGLAVCALGALPMTLPGCFDLW